MVGTDRRARWLSATGLAVLGALVAGGLGSGLAAWRFADPTLEPTAAATGEPRLPDRFHQPGRRLPGTDDAGPIGPLVALTTAERGALRTRLQTVGVSAVTGEYRFLDLPGVLPYGEELSPDGRHVAYWIGGPTREEAHFIDPSEGEDETVEPDRVATGYAVYDTVSGSVVARERFPTDHGLDPYALVWADDDTLAMNFHEFANGGRSDEPEDPTAVLLVRDLRSAGAARQVAHRGERDWTLVSSDGRGRLVLYGTQPRSFTIVDTTDGDAAREVSMDRELGAVVPELAPGGASVAEVDGDERGSVLLVGRVREDGTVRLRRVPGFAVESHALGWVDEHHVVVSTEWAEPGAARVLRVDVRTGRAALLTRGSPQLALGLLDARPVAAPPPEEPPSPVPAAIASLSFLLLAGMLGFGMAALRRST